MKKAVIESGGVQYMVAKGDSITVNFVGEGKKTIDFVPLMIVDGKNSVVDAKTLSTMKVSADVTEPELKGDKVVSIRYKAKKRVNTRRGHRQLQSQLLIKSV